MAFSFKNALSRCVYSRIRITHLQIQEVHPTSKSLREGTPSIKMPGVSTSTRLFQECLGLAPVAPCRHTVLFFTNFKVSGEIYLLFTAGGNFFYYPFTAGGDFF